MRNLNYVIVITGTDDTHFVFAIPASYYDFAPIVIVSAKKGTFVNLKMLLFSATYYVNDNSSRTFIMDHNLRRVTSGVESKGIEVTSDEPVSVTIGTQYQQDYYIPDEIMVRPITADDTEYIINSYPGTSSSSSSTHFPNSYFMIIPQFNESLVQVFTFENDIWVQQYSVVLSKFEVFTHDSFYAKDGYTDYTGWRVIASQPVAVISGNGYANFGIHLQHICDSLPSIAKTGSHYVTFPVLFGRGGYVVRIVGSTTEDINVMIPDVQVDEIISRGGFLDVECLDSSSMMSVSYPVLRLYKVGLLYDYIRYYMILSV